MSRVPAALVILAIFSLACARHVVVERDRVAELNDKAWRVESPPSEEGGESPE